VLEVEQYAVLFLVGYVNQTLVQNGRVYIERVLSTLIFNTFTLVVCKF